MPTLKELIDLHCPDGVDYVRLGDVATRQRGTAITASKMKELDRSEGEVLVFAAGSTVARLNENDLPKDSVHRTPSVVVKARGYIGFQFVNHPFTTKSELWSYRSTDKNLNIKYLVHYLCEHVSDFQTIAKMNGVKLPQLKVTDTDNYHFPLPPREVQDKIVDMLDAFAAVCDNLDKEIAQREEQFRAYRKLLFSSNGVAISESRSLGEIADTHNTTRKPITKKDRVPGTTPYYGASGVVDYVEGFTHNGDFLLVSEDGANLVLRSTPIAFSISGENWVNNHAHVLAFPELGQQKYVEYFLNQLDLTPWISTAAQPKLTKARLHAIPIPYPPLPVQQDIADKLDAMQALIDNLKLEREQRQQQFEYYRTQLLTFPAKDTADND